MILAFATWCVDVALDLLAKARIVPSCAECKSSAEFGTAASCWAGNSGSSAAQIPESSERSGCGTTQDLFLTGNCVCMYFSDNIDTNSIPYLLLITQNGNFALQTAIMSHCDESVIELVLEAYPPAAKNDHPRKGHHQAPTLSCPQQTRTCIRREALVEIGACSSRQCAACDEGDGLQA